MRTLLSDIFDPQSIKLNLEGKTKEAVFIELADAIAAVNPECDRASVLASIWERENKLSTGIISGVALPHAFYEKTNNIAGAIGVSQTGIEYDALDNKPVYVVFMLVIGGSEREKHLHILNQISRLAQSELLATIKEAQNTQAIQTILSRF